MRGLLQEYHIGKDSLRARDPNFKMFVYGGKDFRGTLGEDVRTAILLTKYKINLCGPSGKGGKFQGGTVCGIEFARENPEGFNKAVNESAEAQKILNTPEAQSLKSKLWKGFKTVGAPLGKTVLGAVTPAGVLGYELSPWGAVGRVRKGESAKDVALSPWTYAGLPWMSTAVKAFKNPWVQKALSLGLPMRVIAGMTPVGLAALGLTGLYQAGKYFKGEKNFQESLSPRELELWQDKYESIDPMAAGHGYAGRQVREGWKAFDADLRKRYAVQQESMAARNEKKKEDKGWWPFKDGGITTIPRRPGALPPKRGPDPYGQKIKEGIVSLT